MGQKTKVQHNHATALMKNLILTIILNCQSSILLTEIDKTVHIHSTIF